MIPVMPFPVVDPGPPSHTRGQRASDADRETAVDILCAAVADRRLDLTELEERVEAALSAKTLTELAALIADLFPCFPRELPCPHEPATPSRVSSARSGWSSASAGRWQLICSLMPAQ